MKRVRLFLLLGVVVMTAVMATAVWRLAVAATAVVDLVINEVDYTQPGLQDGGEFIEILNKGDSPANLDFYRIDLVDGANTPAVIYESIDLPAFTLMPGDYYVICTDPVDVINCDLVVAGPDLIQNGAPDAVALWDLLDQKVDVVSYEGDTALPYREGSGEGLVDEDTRVFAGIGRDPEGTDTDQNNVDFSSRCITPGLPNILQSTDCEILFDPRPAVALTAVPDSLPEPGGVVSVTVEFGNKGLLSLTLTGLTDDTGLNLNGQGSCQVPQTIEPAGGYNCVYTSTVAGLYGMVITRTVTAAGEDDFDNPFVQDGQVGITLTQRTRWDVYLPLLLGERPYGEPNDTCDEAYAMAVNQPRSFFAEDVQDWYAFELAQSSPLHISWQNFIPAEGQLVVYRGACADWELVGNEGSTAVNRTLTLETQPAGHYLILIINDGPLNGTDLYTLHVQTQ